MGVELFPEFNNPAYSGGTCPGGSGGAAFPCVPEGAYAHELGHTLQLPHPADVPATSQSAPHSIMQTHWNYPCTDPCPEMPWGFLTIERQTILANPFMKWDVPLVQTYPDCHVVNLPVTGSPPVADFEVTYIGPTSVALTNTSTGAGYSFWTFGDGGVSGAMHPVHSYDSPGSYPISLRAMASNAMIDTTTQPVVFDNVATDGPTTPARIDLHPARPNPARGETVIDFDLTQDADVELAIYGIDGRREAVLARGRLPAGRHSVRWNATSPVRGNLPPGLYLLRLEAGGHVAARRAIRIQ
jgi:hypothetical protein